MAVDKRQVARKKVQRRSPPAAEEGEVYEYYDRAGHLIERETVPPADQGYAGHSAGIHPEDSPYTTSDIVSKRYPYAGRQPTRTTQVVNPAPKTRVLPRSRLHWSFFFALGAVGLMMLWIAMSLLISWWQEKQTDWTYGHTRTYQTDAYIVHGSTKYLEHFIVINLRGTIDVLEINPTRPQFDQVYIIETVGDSSMVATVSFQVVNGKQEMLVAVGSSNFTVVYVNNGKTFVPAS